MVNASAILPTEGEAQFKSPVHPLFDFGTLLDYLKNCSKVEFIAEIISLVLYLCAVLLAGPTLARQRNTIAKEIW